jgi:hypothetical protein
LMDGVNEISYSVKLLFRKTKQSVTNFICSILSSVYFQISEQTYMNKILLFETIFFIIERIGYDLTCFSNFFSQNVSYLQNLSKFLILRIYWPV